MTILLQSSKCAAVLFSCYRLCLVEHHICCWLFPRCRCSWSCEVRTLLATQTILYPSQETCSFTFKCIQKSLVLKLYLVLQPIAKISNGVNMTFGRYKASEDIVPNPATWTLAFFSILNSICAILCSYMMSNLSHTLSNSYAAVLYQSGHRQKLCSLRGWSMVWNHQSCMVSMIFYNFTS